MTLYKVSRALLTQFSTIFYEMFTGGDKIKPFVEPDASQPADGTDDQCPIFLPSLTCGDWELFLKGVLGL